MSMTLPPSGEFDEGPPSYWRATAEIDYTGAHLQRDLSVDVAIVGSGYTGLSAAHYLADRGIDCVVLDANPIGWGASGRSAGFFVLRYKRGFSALASRYGTDGARRLHALLLEARDNLEETVDRYGLSRFVSPSGHLTAAHSIKAVAGLEADRQWLAREVADKSPRILDRNEIVAATGTRDYVGGYLDPRGGAIHPLNFVRGFARGIADRGVPIYTNATVSSIQSDGDTTQLHTSGGTVRAKRTIFATNAYTDLAAYPADLAQRIVSVSSSILATDVLPEHLRASIMSCGAPLTDTKRLLNGYRLLPDGRLMVTGRGDLTGRDESPAAYEPLRRAFTTAFPSLADIAISYRWSGKVALPLDDLPHIGFVDGRTVFAIGCTGRGVLLSHLLGRYAARLVVGEQVEAGPMTSTSLSAIPFHQFRNFAMRSMAHYYGLRDRLDVRAS